MSDEKLHKYAKVNVQKKSGFDKGHKNLLTTKCGTLTPLMVDELIPNTTVHLGTTINACLPPLASDSFMNVDLKVEAFFVPSRILYGGYEDWITGNVNGKGKYSAIPALQMNGALAAASAGTGTLSDYLGFKTTKADVTALGSGWSGTSIVLNAFPYLAYHKIYDDWYRNPLVQVPLFDNDNHYMDTAGTVRNIPSSKFTGATADTVKNVNIGGSGVGDLGDGVHILSLRQRNFGIDYFTSATPKAQAGDASKVTIDTSTQSSEMTIAALRAANSLQQFLERNNLAGTRYVDYVHAQYGANLPDAQTNRSMYLGSQTFNVYSKGINSTSSVDEVDQRNPFYTVGAQYGQAQCAGSGNLIDSFTAQEHGYLMVICSLVPKATYGSGIRKMLKHYTANGSRSDMANPILQNVGNQPITRGELMLLDGVAQPSAVFGYTDRYAEFMTMEDELHGNVRDGYNLESFALQRNFLNTGVTISSNFLEIPKDYMDQVAATTSDISNYGCWIDSYLDYKVSQPLARYSTPSLQDPAAEHGVEITVRKGGTRLD